MNISLFVIFHYLKGKDTHLQNQLDIIVAVTVKHFANCLKLDFNWIIFD
ncbi:hypothetical protein FEM08_04230 [Flavobacterium gilvum]|nr:hypothetical protein FEM08_04230 [Flavobacterium gilvum]